MFLITRARSFRSIQYYAEMIRRALNLYNHVRLSVGASACLINLRDQRNIGSMKHFKYIRKHLPTLYIPAILITLTAHIYIYICNAVLKTNSLLAPKSTTTCIHIHSLIDSCLLSCKNIHTYIN